MPPMSNAPARILDPTQAAELSLLVDLEARWENLRNARRPSETAATDRQHLEARQRAYEAFHGRLVAYNKRYTPTHVPELLLNTPPRLAVWCRVMRDLYAQVEHAPKGHCPVHVLEKAYRCADQISARLHKERVERTPPPATIGDAVRDLEALGQWCHGLLGVATADAAVLAQ